MTTKKATTKAEPTEYVVVQIFDLDETLIDALASKGLVQGEGERSYVTVEVDRITAVGQEKPLIEKWAARKGVGGAFKLIPARSWKGGVRVFEQTRVTSEPIA